MAFDPRKNPYRGVNAHLHSFLQNSEFGAWKMFHNAYIDDVARALDSQLPSGYEVGMITSLQISEYHRDTGEKIRVKRPEPDVTIYQSSRIHPASTEGVLLAQPTLVIPAVETMTLTDEAYLISIMIYRIRDDYGRTPVTRIEVLSPTNKPPGEGFEQYTEKRDATLAQELPLIEIDFLHESRPALRNVPSYPDRHSNSHPYTIYVTDTRSVIGSGDTSVYGFDVDIPVPHVPIPLGGKDKLAFDFGLPYGRTFSAFNYFHNRIDYAKEPIHFNTYAPADQERIRARMAAIASERASTE